MPTARRLASDLQEKILKQICTLNDADFGTISTEINRSRVTVLQALRHLILGYYVDKHKAQPNRIKSKLYFTPTEKGICYALVFLDLDIEEVAVEASHSQDITEYLQMIRNMQNRQGGKLFLKNIADCAIRDDCFRRGNLSIKNKDALFLKSYMMTVLDISISTKGPFRQLFANNEFEKFKAIFTPDDIPIFENSLKNMIRNINTNNERLINSLD